MVELHRTPHIVRLKIEEAQSILVDLDNEMKISSHEGFRALLSRLSVALDSAHEELIDAQCDAEAALSRIG